MHSQKIRKLNFWLRFSAFSFVKARNVPLWLSHFPQQQQKKENSPIKRKNYLKSLNLLLHFHPITWLFRKLCCMLLFVLETQFLCIIYFSENKIREPEFKISRNSPVQGRNKSSQVTEKSLPVAGVFGQLAECTFYVSWRNVSQSVMFSLNSFCWSVLCIFWKLLILFTLKKL